MKALDRVRTALKKPKVMAGVGAALVAVVLIARGGRSSSSTSDAAPAAASDVGSYGAMMPYGGGYAFSSDSFTDSDNTKALHDRFDLLEDTLAATNAQVYDTQTALATSQAAAAEVTTSQTALAGVVAGLSQLVSDLQSQRPSIGTMPDAAAPSPTTPPAVTPPVSSVSQQVTRPPTSAGGDRWTPPANAVVGKTATNLAGTVFAGRKKLTNGQYAPIIRYTSTGNSQIHPEWQRWMASNGVRVA